MKNDSAYLAHIQEAIQSIQGYLEGISCEQFKSSKMVVDAVVRELEIIGEATNNLSPDFRAQHPDMLWRRTTDMRNFLIHEYFGVNTKVVWDTCKNDLPSLKGFIAAILDQ